MHVPTSFQIKSRLTRALYRISKCGVIDVEWNGPFLMN